MKSGTVDDAPNAPQQPIVVVAPRFTREEGDALLSLIKTGWSSAVVGSRQGYELLASIEDKLVASGASGPGG